MESRKVLSLPKPSISPTSSSPRSKSSSSRPLSRNNSTALRPDDLDAAVDYVLDGLALYHTSVDHNKRIEKIDRNFLVHHFRLFTCLLSLSIIGFLFSPYSLSRNELLTVRCADFALSLLLCLFIVLRTLSEGWRTLFLPRQISAIGPRHYEEMSTKRKAIKRVFNDRLVWSWVALIVTLLVFVDSAIQLFSMLADSSSAADTVEDLLPSFSHPFRFLLFIYYAHRLRALFTTIAKSIPWLFVDIVPVSAFVLIIYSILGAQLFANNQSYYVCGRPEEACEGGNFEVVSAALVSLFTLLSTENWPAVFYPSLSNGKVEHSIGQILYFVSFLFIALFIIAPTIVAVSFDVFKEQFAEGYIRKRARIRRGFIHAFHRLDHDQSGILTLRQWQPFYVKLRRSLAARRLLSTHWLCPCRRTSQAQLRHHALCAFRAIDVNGSGSIDLFEFFKLVEVVHVNVEEIVEEVEQTAQIRRSAANSRATSRANSRRNSFGEGNPPSSSSAANARAEPETLQSCLSAGREKVTAFVENAVFNLIIGVLIILNTALLCFDYYGQPDERTLILNSIDRAFLTFFVFEIALRLFAHRWTYFKSNVNRLDFSVVALSVVLAGVEIAQFAELSYFPLPLRLSRIRLLRLARLLRPLRLISWHRRLQVLAETAISLFSFVSQVFILLSLIIHSYATLGIVIFKGTLASVEICSDDNGIESFDYDPTVCCSYCYANPAANFDSFLSACLALFQLLTTSNWHEIMEAYIHATNRSAALFFTSFFFFSVLVIFNILVALMLDTFSIQRELMKDEEKRSIIVSLVNLGKETAGNATRIALGKGKGGKGHNNARQADNSSLVPPNAASGRSSSTSSTVPYSRATPARVRMKTRAGANVGELLVGQSKRFVTKKEIRKLDRSYQTITGRQDLHTRYISSPVRAQKKRK